MKINDLEVEEYIPVEEIPTEVTYSKIVNHAILPSREQVVELLQQLQKDRPYDVRFHVDRQGRPAYLLLSENLLKEMGGDEHH